MTNPNQLFDNSKDKKDLLDAEQVAKKLNVSPKTIYRWAKTRRLPSISLGQKFVRFRQEDIDQILSGARNL